MFIGLGIYNFVHTTEPDETANKTVCFNCSEAGDACFHETAIQVKNCGNYFLYYLPDVLFSRGYCGSPRYCSR